MRVCPCVEIRSRTLIPPLRQRLVHNGPASWDDCDRVFQDKLRVSSLLDRFPHYTCTAAQSAHSDFVGSRVYACLDVTCHLHSWQNDQGLLHATAVTQGWNGHQRRVSTQSQLWRRKFSHRSCRDSNSQPFDHKPSTLTTSYPSSHQLSGIPGQYKLTKQYGHGLGPCVITIQILNWTEWEFVKWTQVSVSSFSSFQRLCTDQSMTAFDYHEVTLCGSQDVNS